MIMSSAKESGMMFVIVAKIPLKNDDIYVLKKLAKLTLFIAMIYKTMDNTVIAKKIYDNMGSLTFELSFFILL